MITPDSVKARLKQLAVIGNKPFDYLLTYYFIERIIYRISVSAYADNFILKGGLLLYTILENDARATRDIDFLARRLNNTLENLTNVFASICSIELDDAVRFDLNTITAERIKEGADYEGVRVKVTGFLDKTRHVLQLDIGFGDVVIPKPVITEYPTIFDMEPPLIYVYSRESVIAEKFEAMLYLAEANSRMKDFYDIYSLCTSFDFDGRVLYEAILQTITRRKTHTPQDPTVFDKDFANNRDKATQWGAFKRRTSVGGDLEFPQVTDVIGVFLKPIYECIVAEKEFIGYWEKDTGRWTV